MDKVFTDRTRTIAYQRCHRLGWLTTYEGGKGLQRKGLNLHLHVGTLVHAGINGLFKGKEIDDVLFELSAGHQELTEQRVVEDCLSDYQQQMLNDCWNLVEAQVRAFELVMLPQLLEQYDVLDTEKEECCLLDSGQSEPVRVNSSVDGHSLVVQDVTIKPELWWMARLDATLKDRQTGDIGPLSIKTTGRWDKRKEDAAKHDMQGCSEMWTLQQRNLGIEWGNENASGPDPVMFVQMLYILKGTKKENLETGQWEFWSPLTKGYRRLTNEGEEWAHSYWWTCKEMHIKGYTKKGEALWCEGGKKHNCQGWEPVDIASQYDGGVGGWIRDLHAMAIQPNADETDDLLAQQFIFPAPVYRSPQEIERWKRSTVYEKRQIIRDAEEIQQVYALTGEIQHKEELLDKYFPMYTHSCDYPSRCSMQDICHGGVEDPVGSGLYEVRKVNHLIEEAE